MSMYFAIFIACILGTFFVAGLISEIVVGDRRFPGSEILQGFILPIVVGLFGGIAVGILVCSYVSKIQ